MATGSTLVIATPANPTEGDRITFHWTTGSPDPKNWVGIYDGTRQPGNGSSLLWKYTPGGAGDVQLDTSALTGGPYTAYLLAKDGYGILAQTAPFTFRPKPAAPRPHAVVDALTTAQSAPGATVSVKLAGLWVKGTGTAVYRKVSGDSWLSVAADGTVSGTAPAAQAHPALVTVGIKDPAGATDTVTVQIPVRDPAGPLTLKAATWNLANAGAAFTDAVEKQLAAVLTQGLDVVALQETAGTAARTLATALGWYAYQSSGSVGILSRWPLAAVTAPTASLPAAGATVQLPGGRTVRFWAAHLDEANYGPYAIQDGQTAAQVQAAEAASTRGRQAAALAAAVQADIAAGQRVVLAAGLASPSHLDWTGQGGRPALAWPVTTALRDAGLTDAYRSAHPDPVASPGNTWSPTRTVRGSRPEPQDRIDQVQFAGALTLVEAHTLATGWPQAEPNAAANGWPSDTAAAVATFTL
ncbi:endonuclease/exonuclease/phosphatase family protein [Kitasatospora sp. DSM 101779]|uniref:endonuclease/exonuclease/phosphatase family protein n=1 Tax=Kitasatospora sp. DSM 101779 TaxID=2853165 RepID=UPI0021DB7BF0|nr:endonuclease/exonuclease/phosphatase family protein [Kitasatospora sp. DSM 101779]MCU7822360.1 endonuclease/exonuclease/phosphatase family protein [Kitasatospora sp. DSM 101779]